MTLLLPMGFARRALGGGGLRLGGSTGKVVMYPQLPWLGTNPDRHASRTAPVQISAPFQNAQEGSLAHSSRHNNKEVKYPACSSGGGLSDGTALTHI